MKLIIALGNPGKEFEKTRHNFAQIIVKKWLSSYDFLKLKKNEPLKSETTQGQINSSKAIVAFPMTYMNNSGDAAALLKNYFKLKFEDIIVVHDDIDIPFGRIKVSENVGSAGHKGVQSIINLLKTKDLKRIRLGIGSEEQGNIPTENYVLQKFSKEEQEHFQIIAKMAGEALDMVVKDKTEKAMNMFN